MTDLLIPDIIFPQSVCNVQLIFTRHSLAATWEYKFWTQATFMNLSRSSMICIVSIARFGNNFIPVPKMSLNLSIPDISLTRKKQRNIQTEKREAEY